MTSNYCFATSAVTSHNFTNQEIIDSNGFQVTVDVVFSEHENSEITIGVGQELGFDPNNFAPSNNADATVTVRDNEVEVQVFEAGVLVSSTTHATPIPAAFIENVKVDVETSSFAAASPAQLKVYVNDNPNYVPSTAFHWDGGANHIEVRGGAGVPDFDLGLPIEIDNLDIRPR